MAILKPAARLIVRDHAKYALKGPLLSLGVPEIYATYDELQEWSRDYLARDVLIGRGDAQHSTNKIGARLGWVSARTFFRAIGIDDFQSLDLPGSEHKAEIHHDLNDPLPPQWHGKYQTVFDPGTLEHVFDQRACLENIADALAPGGVAIHVVPVYSYNGGYYSINPNVLHDFYRANGFGDISAYIVMWDRYRPYSTRRTRCYVYREDVLGSRHALTEADQVRYTPHLVMFARKKETRTQYIAPLQFDGRYAEEASALRATRAQTLEKLGKRWAPTLQRIVPLGLALYVQAVVYRRLMRWRARKSAGFFI